jgi:hypothetical protein
VVVEVDEAEPVLDGDVAQLACKADLRKLQECFL